MEEQEEAAYLTENAQLLGIGLGKVAGGDLLGVGGGVGGPGVGNGGQLLQVGGQPLSHDSNQLGMDLLLVHAQILQNACTCTLLQHTFTCPMQHTARLLPTLPVTSDEAHGRTHYMLLF